MPVGVPVEERVGVIDPVLDIVPVPVPDTDCVGVGVALELGVIDALVPTESVVVAV